MHRVLTPSDHRRMPWKNGGGSTTEIATHPPGATLDAFDWRVSVADVAADGPCSRFPGIDRVLLLLSGAGIRLTGDGHDVELRAAFEPYAFRGDDAIEGWLVAGPVRNFNVMLRRGRARGTVDVVRAAGARIPAAAHRLCYAAAGCHECLRPGHPPLTVAPDEVLLIEADGDDPALPLVVNPLAADAVALVVVIECP
ncbi:MAG: HutD family protein [Betaproteobacteria bacterium]